MIVVVVMTVMIIGIEAEKKKASKEDGVMRENGVGRKECLKEKCIPHITKNQIASQMHHGIPTKEPHGDQHRYQHRHRHWNQHQHRHQLRHRHRHQLWHQLWHQHRHRHQHQDWHQHRQRHRNRHRHWHQHQHHHQLQYQVIHLNLHQNQIQHQYWSNNHLLPRVPTQLHSQPAQSQNREGGNFQQSK